MSAERYRRLRALFDEALEQAEGERERWCERQCGDDHELLRDLRRLLERESQQRGQDTSSAGAVIAAALDQAANRRLAGAVIDRYTLCEEIGQGGMGRVFRATRTDAGVVQEVALKLLRRELINEAMLERFRGERRILAGLNHPCIARLLDLGETSDGVPYVAMELVRGVPITRYCAQQRLDVRGRLQLFQQVLAAVSHAHRNLIVHRDIKPANVLVDTEGRIKLLDFGIAKPLHGDAAATATGLRLLTPNYAAPEQFTGGDASVMTDVYALGALLYEMLSGHPPFALDGLSAGEVERRVLLIPPESLTQAALDADTAERLGQMDVHGWRRALRGDLDAIVQKALRKEPQRRYLSAEQMDADIERYLRQEPVLASGNSRAYRFGKFVQRHRLLLAVVSGAFVAVSVALGLAIRQAHIAEAERDTARAAMAVIGESFKAADPMRSSRGQIRAADILQVAIARTAPLRERQPLLHASLMAELGEAELAVGMAQTSTQAVEAALTWARSTTEQLELRRRLLMVRARQELARRDFKAADRYLVELEGAAQDASPAVMLIRTHYLLAIDQAERAVSLAKRAASELDAEGDRSAYIDALWQLAEARSMAGQYDEALATLEIAAAITPAELAGDSPKAQLAKLRRARLQINAERADASTRDSVREAVNALEKHYPTASTMMAFAYAVLGRAEEAVHDDLAALGAYRQSADAYRNVFGPSNLDAVRAQFNVVERMTKLRLPNADTEFAKLMDHVGDSELRGGELEVYFRLAIADLRKQQSDLAGARAALLPHGYQPDMNRLGASYRDALLETIVELYGPIACADPLAQAQSAAVNLYCSHTGPHASDRR